ncbi:hypothetical protein [cyanobacterium endosymbiont of Epithemia turgida]|jgi:hypothetical protein|uniref:hypothetical protein n=1 Tax=cyanobacterium endosymbiont of Epithemia turgida TaxID=718217 RepID=UPI001494CA80|nr:hypothetical protein [cyanobacterium endosymbiont of Epithemia turgida]
MSLTGSILTIFPWLSPSFAQDQGKGGMTKTIDVLLVYLLPRLDPYPNIISFWD